MLVLQQRAEEVFDHPPGAGLDFDGGRGRGDRARQGDPELTAVPVPVCEMTISVPR